MTSPSAHQGYITIAGRALRGRESIPAMSDWEIFLHGFCDTNQNGDSRQIYDCLIDLFPTPEAVLDWPVTDRVTGDPLELPEAGWNGEPGGCANFRSRVGAGGWLRTNVEPANWRKIRSLMRCKRRDGSQIPGRQDQAKDFSNGSRLKRDGTRDEPGGLNYQLRAAIAGAGMKGADMHLLWGGCEVPVIDIQLIRYMAPHKLGMEMREYARQKLIVLKAEGYSLELNADRPKAQRTTIAAEDIETDEIPQSNDEAAIRKAQGATAHISAMERQEVSAIQNSQPLYGEWRDFAYEMAEKEDLKANVWHVANWMEFRQSGGDPDRKGRRSQAVIAGDAARLTDTLEFANRTFGPTDFPDAPAEWPLPNVRYPRRERRNRLARLRAEGFSIPAMAVEEGISQRDVVSDLAYYDRILAGRGQTPGDYDREKTPPIFHGTIFDFTPEEIGRGTSGEGVWLSSNREAAEKISRMSASSMAPEGAKKINGARILSYRIKPEARIHTIPYWDGVDYEPLVEAMVREGADVLEIVRTGDIAAWRNRASYYLVQNPSVLEPVSIAESSRGVTGFHEVSLWDAPETPGAYDPELVDRINAGIDRLTSLGLRTEIATGYPSYTLHWSNAGAIWHIFYRVHKKGDQVRLDANQLLVQASRPAIEEAMPLLHMLPLYGDSFERHWDWKTHPPTLRPPTQEEDDINPAVFVGFEGPFGFDDNITKESKDWIQYKIGDTPVIVRRVGAKPGVKLDPRYQGANQPQELLIEFRLQASTRRDMEKINFLLERLREDNPTMTVNVNVKTNGKSAQRSLPTWEDRPYRLEPGAWFGFETPKDFDDRIRSWEWRHAEVEEGIAEDGTTIDTLHEGLNGLAGEDRVSTEVITHPNTAPEFGLSAEEHQIYFNNYFSNPDEAEVIWDIDGIKVTVDYHPIFVGQYSTDPYPEEGAVGDAAEISWVRTGGEVSRDTFNQINALLDGIHEENPNIRIFAHAVGEKVTIDPKTKKAIIRPGQKGRLYAPRGRGGIRARVYERSGWTKLYDEQGDEGEGATMMEWLPPDQRNPGTPTAFDGISAYADAIMALV